MSNHFMSVSVTTSHMFEKFPRVNAFVTAHHSQIICTWTKYIVLFNFHQTAKHSPNLQSKNGTSPHCSALNSVLTAQYSAT